MYRLTLRRRFCQTSRYCESDTSLAQTSQNTSKLANVYPTVLNKLPEPEKIKSMLGQDMSQRILEDVHYSVQSQEQDNLSRIESDIKKRELQLYMQSISRLQNNKYAIECKRDEKLLQSRNDQYVENINVPSRLDKRYKRFLGMTFTEYNSLTKSEQKVVERKMLEREEAGMLKAQGKAHEANYKVGSFKMLIEGIKEDMERGKLKKEFRSAMEDGRYKTESNQEEQLASELIEHELHIEHTQGDIDVTVPTAFTKTDLRDEKHRPWTKWSWASRAVRYSIVFVLVFLIVRMCYNDYQRQLAEGGWQGLWLGFSKRIL